MGGQAGNDRCGTACTGSQLTLYHTEIPYHLSKDMIQRDLAEERPSWILSAYGPGKDAPEQLFGGYPREQSAEEIRLHYLTAKMNGNEQGAVSVAWLLEKTKPADTRFLAQRDRSLESDRHSTNTNRAGKSRWRNPVYCRCRGEASEQERCLPAVDTARWYDGRVPCGQAAESSVWRTAGGWGLRIILVRCLWIAVAASECIRCTFTTCWWWFWTAGSARPEIEPFRPARSGSSDTRIWPAFTAS